MVISKQKRPQSYRVRFRALINRRPITRPLRFPTIHWLNSDYDFGVGCRYVSLCYHRQSFSELLSPGRSSTTYDAWVQTITVEEKD